jgi:hypothetical protein
MQTTRFERMTLAKFFVAAWLACFGVTIDHAQAQFVNPVPTPPPPTLNPSTPYTVPQPKVAPVSPGAPSALPGSQVLPPSDEILPRAETHPHRRAVTAPTVTSHVANHVAKPRGGRHKLWHRHWRRIRGTDGTVEGPSYYPAIGWYSPFVWSYGSYPCVWRRHWDGYWVRDCI